MTSPIARALLLAIASAVIGFYAGVPWWAILIGSLAAGAIGARIEPPQATP